VGARQNLTARSPFFALFSLAFRLFLEAKEEESDLYNLERMRG